MHDGQSSGTSVIMVLLCIVMSFDEFIAVMKCTKKANVTLESRTKATPNKLFV